MFPQHVTSSVPVIEIPDDGDAGRTRRPYGKVNSGDALTFDQMSTEMLIEAFVCTLG